MKQVENILSRIAEKYPHEKDFYQSVEEVFEDVIPFIDGNQDIENYNILERLSEPDRIIQFRVTWQNQKGEIEVNRGWRVQYNNSLGPYKGGLRFHPSVTLDTLKFLGFEQTFKNALTGLNMGGGKGGSDFNPKGRSDAEVMSFCQAFMMELYRHIGPNTDVPAGDIGVGGREIGYLFGVYKKITNRFEGVLTGKSPTIGGSLIRKEATGYGSVYFLENALHRIGDSLEGKNCIISGAGNVALYTAEKLLEKGANVVSLSDSRGTLHIKNGLNKEQLNDIITEKEVNRGSLENYHLEKNVGDYHAGKEPWDIEADIAVPSATQNEVDAPEAKSLAKNGVKWVAEAANMPTTAKGVKALKEGGVVLLPAKAVNAGGVSVSGLEMAQNAQYLGWTAERVDQELQEIMANIHQQCVDHSLAKEGVDYAQGANIAGFKKVADAMKSYGTL